jgi:hypothetical protein
VNDEDAPPPLRVERIIAALEENRVKYVLVGGIAGRFHGAQRATSDLDICPAWDRDNLDRLTTALKSLGAHLKGFGHEPEAQGIQNMEVTNWRTASGDIDILLGIPDKSQYERAQYRRLAEDALVVEVGQSSILVASLGAIIRSKEIADRDKDRQALDELRAIEAARGPERGD